MKKKRILAVASIGGHWIQLLRITKPLEEFYEVVYLSTNSKCQSLVPENKFFHIQDFNRWSIWQAIPATIKILFVLLFIRPKAVITTGAAPGLLTLIIARMFFINTIWIDSIANVKRLSSSGKIARKIAHKIYTQWPNLVDNKVKYAGNIFGD